MKLFLWLLLFSINTTFAVDKLQIYGDSESEDPINIRYIIIDEQKKLKYKSLVELLQHQTSINIMDNTGGPDNKIDMRGFGITSSQNNLLLINGLRIDENLLENPSIYNIDLDEVSHIEISESPGSIEYGGGSTAGYINIITKKVYDQKIGILLGNAKQREFSASLQGPIKNSSVNVKKTLTNNYRHYNKSQNSVFNFISQNKIFNGLNNIILTYDKLFLHLPGTRSSEELSDNRRGAQYTNNYIEKKINRVIGNYKNEKMPFKLDYSLSTIYDDSLSFTDYLIESKQDRFILSPKIFFDQKFNTLKSTTSVGLDYDFWKYKIKTTSSFGGVDVDGIQLNKGVFLKNILSDEKNKFFSGIRLQDQSFSFDNLSTNSASATINDASMNDSFEIGYERAINKNLEVYSNFNKSYRHRNFNDNFNLFSGEFIDLLDQESKVINIGLLHNNGNINQRISIFQIDTKNEIHLDPVSFANENYPESRRHGIDYTYDYQSDRYSLKLNYLHLRAKFIQGIVNTDLVDKEVPLVPENQIKSTFDFWYSSDTLISLSLNYVSSKKFDNDELNTFSKEIPSYSLYNLKINKSLGKILIGFNCENIFNKRYFTYGGYNSFSNDFYAYPAPETTYNFYITQRF